MIAMNTGPRGIYSQGLIATSVCVPKGWTKEEVEHYVNLESPTGIDSCWRVKDETFATGEPNPTPCGDSNQHWVLHC